MNGHLPHVLVLDLQMPDGSSIELIRQLRLRVPETQVVVVTMEDGPAYARAAIDAGAMGFVLKQYATHDLTVAVRCAAGSSTSALGWARGLMRCRGRSTMTV